MSGKYFDAVMLLLSGGAGVAALKQQMEILWELTSGTVWDTETDTQEAYQKTVPSGASAAKLGSIAGRTIVWNQLVDTDTAALTLADGVKYLTVIGGTAAIAVGAGTEISVSGGTDRVFDLTAMFGAGNEPASTSDQRISAITAYAAAHPAYNAGALLCADVAELASRDGSQRELGRLSIPTALRAAYPLRSTRNAADTYDFSDGTYEQNVYEYTFTGNETISHQGTLTDVVHTSFSPAANGLPEMHNFGAVYGGDLLSAAIPFRADQSNTVHVTCRNDTIRLFTPSDFGTGSTVEKCKAYLKYLHDSGNPLTVVYVRKEPAESDISAHIPDNLLLKTEAGGTLTFVQTGTELPVPNSVDYLVKLSEVDA